MVVGCVIQTPKLYVFRVSSNICEHDTTQQAWLGVAIDLICKPNWAKMWAWLAMFHLLVLYRLGTYELQIEWVGYGQRLFDPVYRYYKKTIACLNLYCTCISIYTLNGEGVFSILT